jgi:hypothetical protein
MGSLGPGVPDTHWHTLGSPSARVQVLLGDRPASSDEKWTSCVPASSLPVESDIARSGKVSVDGLVSPKKPMLGEASGVPSVTPSRVTAASVFG